MGIFNLEDWRSLWNLEKPPKTNRSQWSTVGANRSCGDLSSQQSYSKQIGQSDVDGPSYHSLGRQRSERSEKRAESLSESLRRELKPPQAKTHRVNGMVEPVSRVQATASSDGVKEAPQSTTSFSPRMDSSPELSTANNHYPSSVRRFINRITLPNDSAWIKSPQELNSSADVLDNRSPTAKPLTSSVKEPVKKWEKQLSRRSTENLNNRYGNPAKTSTRDLHSEEQSATFDEARFKFEQLSQASARGSSPAYNEPLRRRFRSQPNVTANEERAIPRNDEKHLLPNYPRHVEIQKRESLYNRANSSGLPETNSNSFSVEAKPAEFPFADQQARRNIALLGMSSESVGTKISESPVTSTPRSSTRKAKAILQIDSNFPRIPRVPEWETFDITLKKTKGEIGFEIVGGLGDEVRQGDSQIYVTKIIANQAAALDKRLHVGDIITAIDGRRLINVCNKDALRILRRSKPSVCLTVQRFVGKVHVVAITLVKNGQPIGITVTGGLGNEVQGGGTAIYVKKITANGVAERHGGIEVGDQIEKVNGISLKAVTHYYASECLRNVGDTLELVVRKTGRVNPFLFCTSEF